MYKKTKRKNKHEKLTIALLLLSTTAFSGNLLVTPEQEPLESYQNQLIETQYNVVNIGQSAFDIKHILFKVSTRQLAIIYRDTTKTGCNDKTVLTPNGHCILYAKVQTFDFGGKSPYSIKFCQDDKHINCYEFRGNISV